MDDTLYTIIKILDALLTAVLYLGAAAVAFLIISQGKVKEILQGFSKLTHVAIFIITTQLLFSAVYFFVDKFLYLPTRIQAEATLYGIDECILGLIFVIALVVGSVLVVRRTAQNNVE